MSINLRIARDTLTDGSEVFSVVVTDQDGAYLVFDVINESDAALFASGLKALLTTHTNIPTTAPAAPVAMSPYTLRCAAGAVAPVIDVTLYEDNDDTAARVAVMRAKTLHAAGYYRYSLYSPAGGHVAEFTTEATDPHITTSHWPHGPRP